MNESKSSEWLGDSSAGIQSRYNFCLNSCDSRRGEEQRGELASRNNSCVNTVLEPAASTGRADATPSESSDR